MQPIPFHTEHVMDFEASVNPNILNIRRRHEQRTLSIAYFTGGCFNGPKLRGEVLAGGGDWAEFESEDSIIIDVRGVLRTDDRALIYLKYTGYWHSEPGILRGVIFENRPFDPLKHYFRVSATMETDAPRYDWLNRKVFLGAGSYECDGDDQRVRYSFYQVA